MKKIEDGLPPELSRQERYLIRHPDKVKAALRKYSIVHKKEINARGKIWRDNNKEHRKEYMEKYKKENPEKFKANSRKSKLKHSYGITVEEYNYFLETQKGVCAICKRPDEINRKFCVDHKHETGKVRGILCSSCNKALGLLLDDLSILESAVYYLRSNT